MHLIKGLSKFRQLFDAEKPMIGALHFTPMIGYSGFEGLDKVLATAKKDLNAFIKGGINGIIIENNYDNPPKTFVDPETVSEMTYLGLELKKRTKIPIGVSVLWNDYRAALSIAKVIGARFIRVPVFVDSVKTDFDTIYAEPEKVMAYREKIDAKDIMVFADVHVKHATMLDQQAYVATSSKKAQKLGADAIIITGKWTADPPKPEVLREAKESVSVPVLIGSGLDHTNARRLLEYADGAIVSTSLKSGGEVSGERQVKPYTARIDAAKVAQLIKAVKSL